MRLKMLRLICVISGLMMLLVSTSPASVQAATKQKDTRIVVISMPRLTWEALDGADTPSIDKLIGKGSVATLSVRVLGSANISSKGYATFSAGRRSTAPNSNEASFASPQEFYGDKKASVIFSQERGSNWPRSATALGLGFEVTLEANRDTLDKAEVGSFASALMKANRSVAVFGNADMCDRDAPECFERSVAYIGADKNGVLRKGDVSRDLLETPEGSARLTINFDELSKKVADSIKVNDVTVAECSDLERIDSIRNRMEDSVAESQFNEAISRCDNFIGETLSELDLNRDQIYIFAPNAPREHEQTTVFIAAGKSITPGYASSSTTRIKGAVTLVDIGPSILKALNVRVPKSMNQAELDWRSSSDSQASRIALLNEMNERAIARDQTLKPTIWTFVLLFAMMVLVSITAFTREGRIKLIAQYLCFVVLTLPLLTFLLQPFMTKLDTSARLISAITACAFLLGALLFFASRKIDVAYVLLGASGFYLVVQIVDIVFGGRLQFNSIFGNATIVAGRFVGFNNQSFALLASASLLFVAMVREVSMSHKKVPKQLNLILVLFLLVVLLVDGAPQMGSDVGGVLTFTPTVVFVALLLYGRKINIKAGLLAGVATGLVLTVFTLIDLSRPANKRTHLGRYAEQLFHGDGLLTIERKFIASMRSFLRPEMTLMLILGIAFFVFLYSYRLKIMTTLISARNSVTLLLYPGLFLCVIGALLNDSGVTIPSLMILSAVPAVALLALDAADGEN